MSNLPLDIASTLQSASLNRSPSPHHDLNPSTAASKKFPVSPNIAPSPSSSPQSPTSSQQSTIPLSAIHPTPRRRTNIPPLPDLRFEQSYLASIRHTTSRWEIAWITARDQVMMPLVQGVAWTLVVAGWRYWNRGVQMQGAGVGARVRRWWWGVNNWDVPSSSSATG